MPLSLPFKQIKQRLIIWVLALFMSLSSFVSAPLALAQTVSVVAFKSEYGVILINSIKSRAAFDLFESLQVPVKSNFFSQTKIFAPKDKTFRIACTAYSFNYICAVIVYPSKYASLNFDTDEITLNLPAEISKNYKKIFSLKNGEYKLETEDKRLKMSWSKDGFKIKNFRFKGDIPQRKDLDIFLKMRKI